MAIILPKPPCGIVKDKSYPLTIVSGLYGLNCNIGARPPLVGDVNVYITGTDDSNYNAYISDTGGNSWNVGNTNE